MKTLQPFAILLAPLLIIVGTAMAGCVNGKLSPVVAPTVNVLEQVACKLTPVFDPQEATLVADVCDIAVPGTSAVLTGFSAEKRAGASAAPCKFTPVTADGTHQLGVACASICGDMSKASASDPCPAVDAALRADPKAAGAKW